MRFASPLARLLAAFLLAAGCSEARRPAPEEPDTSTAPDGNGGDAAAARYLSAFAFVGAGSGSTRLFLELANRTRGETLARSYGGWIAENEAWLRFLDLRDTLPVARAAWRILPGGGLRVRVGDDSEIVELAHSDGTRRIRLRPGRILAEWTGPTGQREIFALASLERDSVSDPGLLHFRRTASPTGGAGDAGTDWLLLVADARGDGLLVARGGDTASAFAWGWLDGMRSRWTDVDLDRGEEADDDDTTGLDPSADDTTGLDRVGDVAPTGESWRLAIPSGGITGRIEVLPPDSATAPHGVALVRGALETPGETRLVRGIAVRGRLP